MSELEIPDESIRLMIGIVPDYEDEQEVIEGLRPIAAPVVAAELRRLATLLVETDDARALLARADELDPH